MASAILSSWSGDCPREGTSAAFTEKLERLEDQVRETIQDTRAAVEDTIKKVRSTMHEAGASVKRALDIGHQVQRHPWAMLGSSLVAGYFLGNWCILCSP
jgi:ElaB/YqjD/DUF883 family membrane-anchored ribosome-binding protein